MFKKENHSLARINKKLTSHINQWLILHQDIDPRIITMGIVEIHTSADLANSKVIISHTDNPDCLAKKLNKHKHPLHQYLFKNIDIRRIPRIEFTPMDAKLNELLTILDEIDHCE